MKLETKLKHTPAPWHEVKLGDVNRMFIYTDWHKDEDGADRRDEIAIIDTVQNAYPCLPEATAQANARLIAAAPDLLDALMQATILLKHAHDGDPALESQYAVETADAMTAALTKAIGENQE
jgi:hypothetical protein